MRNITFKQLYDELPKVVSPKREFVRTVAELTHKKEVSVKMWLSGYHVPDDLTVHTIAEHVGVDPSGLFPKA